MWKLHRFHWSESILARQEWKKGKGIYNAYNLQVHCTGAAITGFENVIIHVCSAYGLNPTVSDTSINPCLSLKDSKPQLGNKSHCILRGCLTWIPSSFTNQSCCGGTRSGVLRTTLWKLTSATDLHDQLSWIHCSVPASSTDTMIDAWSAEELLIFILYAL